MQYLIEILGVTGLVQIVGNKIKWLPHSPGMVVLDFHFWGFLKN